MNKDRIREEADAFFEWPTADKTYVTTTSMLLFAAVIADMAAEEAALSQPAPGEPVAIPLDESLYCELEGVIIDAERDGRFDSVCLDTLRRVQAQLRPTNAAAVEREALEEAAKVDYSDLIGRLRKKYGHSFEVLNNGVQEGPTRYDFTRHPLIAEVIRALRNPAPDQQKGK